MIKILGTSQFVLGEDFQLPNTCVCTPEGRYWIGTILYDEKNKTFGMYVGGKLIATLKKEALEFIDD